MFYRIQTVTFGFPDRLCANVSKKSRVRMESETGMCRYAMYYVMYEPRFSAEPGRFAYGQTINK